MSCPEAEKVYLYHADELSENIKSEFERHLAQCSSCQDALKVLKETWDESRSLDWEQPSREIREAIFQEAKETVSALRQQKPSVWRDFWTPQKGIGWGISLAAATVILILFVVNPFHFGHDSIDDALIWQDDFLAEAHWMESEIERVDAGDLLAFYDATEQQKGADEQTWISPMNQDLNWIRENMENLVKNIYGI